MKKDQTLNKDQIMKRLRNLVDKGSQTSVAQELGVSASYLGDVLHGRREVGPSILRALGLEREVSYRETTGEQQ